MFNLIDGEIDIGEIRINRRYTKNSFLLSILYTKVIREYKNSYSIYDLGLQKIDEKLFYVSLHFGDNGLIHSLSFSSLIENEKLSWSGWSKEKELLRKELNDEWLYNQLGEPPYKYGWGEIVSESEIRSGSGHITIIYSLGVGA